MRRALIALILSAAAAACAYPTKTVVQGTSSGTIMLTGSPPGARVFVDGADMGDAYGLEQRKQALSVAPGPHSVRVTLNGSTLVDQRIYVGPESQVQVRVQ